MDECTKEREQINLTLPCHALGRVGQGGERYDVGV